MRRKDRVGERWEYDKAEGEIEILPALGSLKSVPGYAGQAVLLVVNAGGTGPKTRLNPSGVGVV